MKYLQNTNDNTSRLYNKIITKLEIQLRNNNLRLYWKLRTRLYFPLYQTMFNQLREKVT